MCIRDRAHALGWIMRFPEHREQLPVARQGGIEHHPHHLRMTGATATDLVVSRIGRSAAGIADRRAVYPRLGPEFSFRAPETAQSEQRLFHADGKGRLQRMIVHVMPRRNRQRRRPSGQSLFRAGYRNSA